MRKRMAALGVVIMLCTLMAVPALAHGHGRMRAVRYEVCAIADCTLAGAHLHDGKVYTAHTYGDGHDYHGYCDIADCVLAGYHAHDGTYCFAHTTYDGHGHHHTGAGRRGHH